LHRSKGGGEGRVGRAQECHIEMSEEALNGLLEKEGVTPDRVLGVPIMHAETFKRIMLHVRARAQDGDSERKAAIDACVLSSS